MIDTVSVQPESELPEWERLILESAYLEDDPAYWRAPEVPTDPKKNSQRAFQSRHRRAQNHGTRGTKRDATFRVSWKHYGNESSDPRLQDKDTIIGEQLNDADPSNEHHFATEQADLSAWNKENLKGLDGQPATYNTESTLVQIEATRTLSYKLLAKLAAGEITRGEALLELLKSSHDDERERLFTLAEEYANDLDTDSVAEMLPVLGAGSLVAKQTLGVDPYEDIDYLDGFHVVDESKL